MATKHLLLSLFATLLVGVFLSGCGAAPGSGSDEGSETTARTAGPVETTERSEPGGSRPPESTLSYGGKTIVGGLGTYCWSSNSVSQCVDAIGVTVREEALTVPAGSTLTFAYGGEKLDSLNVGAYRIGRGNHLEKTDEGSVLVPEGSKGYKAIELPADRSGNRAQIAAELPAGNYVIETFVRVPQGDASYGFRVVVE